MKIAYLTTYDSDDITKWSGLGYYMRKCIADQGVEVIPVNCSPPKNYLKQYLQRFGSLITGKKQQAERNPSYLRSVASMAEKQLKNIDHDLVFSPGSLPVSFLRSQKPVVFWTDATFDSLSDFYNSGFELDSRTVKNGNLAEQRSINKAALIFYSSEWGRSSAIRKYHADPAKVKRLPFGSNLEHDSTVYNISAFISARVNHPEIRLLFVGVDWKRKGGELAMATVEALTKKGHTVKLVVVGCAIPEKLRSDPRIEHYSFISKHKAAGQEMLKNLYVSARFFILPSVAECTPVVFSEAASFGLPVLTTKVGGLTSIEDHGVTGFCFPLDSFAESAANTINSLISSPQTYRRMSLDAFNHYQQYLNWKEIGKKAVNAMFSVLSNQ